MTSDLNNMIRDLDQRALVAPTSLVPLSDAGLNPIGMEFHATVAAHMHEVAVKVKSRGYQVLGYQVLGYQVTYLDGQRLQRSCYFETNK